MTLQEEHGEFMPNFCVQEKGHVQLKKQQQKLFTMSKTLEANIVASCGIGEVCFCIFITFFMI